MYLYVFSTVNHNFENINQTRVVSFFQKRKFDFYMNNQKLISVGKMFKKPKSELINNNFG